MYAYLPDHQSQARLHVILDVRVAYNTTTLSPPCRLTEQVKIVVWRAESLGLARLLKASSQVVSDLVIVSSPSLD
jgi:hypothetical protein